MTGLREQRSRSLHGTLFDDDRPSPVDFSTAGSDAALHAPGTRRHRVDVSDALLHGRRDSIFTDADLDADFTSDLADDVLAPPAAFSASSNTAPAPRDPLIEIASKSGSGGGGGQDAARGGGGGDAGANAITARQRAVAAEFAASGGEGSLSVTTQTSGNPPTAVPTSTPSTIAARSAATSNSTTVKSYDALPPQPKVVELRPADLSNSGVHYYWVDQIANAQVTVTGTIAGTTLSASTTFNVDEPDFSFLTGTTTTAVPPLDVRNGLIDHLQFGVDVGSSGIDVTGKFSVPTGGAGSIGFIQLRAGQKTSGSFRKALK